MMELQIKQFREILFWTLEIPCLSDSKNQKQADDFERFFANGMHWQREHDLLARGDVNTDAGSLYAEFVFFHPFVQRFLYPVQDEKHPPIRLYKRDDIKWVFVSLDDKTHLSLKVDRIHFYLFDHGVGILVVEVNCEVPASLEKVEDFLDRFRRAYPPYWETHNGAAGHCPLKVQWLNRSKQSKSNYEKAGYFVSSVTKNHAAIPSLHWQYLLDPLEPWKSGLKDDSFTYRQIEDERLSFMAYIVVDDPGQLKRGDFVRLCFADGRGTSARLPYAHAFLHNFEDKYCYDRYWDPEKKYLRDDHWENPWVFKSDGHWLTTRYLCCGYGFTMVGKQDNGGFFTDGKNGALSHFRRHYFQMGLIAHFHRAALLLYSDALSRAVAEYDPDTEAFHQEISAILQRLLHFTHRYWFREVSNQVQPRELFAWWTERLETQALFDQVKQEAQDANDFLETQAQKKLSEAQKKLAEASVQLSLEQRKLAEAARRLSVIAIIGLPVGLIAAFLAIDWDRLDNRWPDWKGLVEDGPIVISVVSLVIIGLALTVRYSERLAEWIDKIAGKGRRKPKA